MNLRVRSDAAELMDLECEDETDYRRCLADLAQVNTVTLARWPTLQWLKSAIAKRPGAVDISVFDVAFGQGDMLRAIAKQGQAHGQVMRLAGVDLNPAAAEAARLSSPGIELALQTGDVFTTTLEAKPDYIVSSLFTHHLSNEQVLAFIQWMERHAGYGWFVNDLHRHVIPYYGFRLLSRTMRWHRFVQHDGSVSIARAFRRAEWKTLLKEAGVAADVDWRFPFRLCVSRLR